MFIMFFAVLSMVVVKAWKEFKKIIYLNRKPVLLKAALSESEQEFIGSFIRHKYLCAGTGEPWGYKGHKTDGSLPSWSFQSSKETWNKFLLQEQDLVLPISMLLF